MTSDRLAARIFVSMAMAKVRIRGAAMRRMLQVLHGPDGFLGSSDPCLKEALGGPPDAVTALIRFLGVGSREEACRSAARLAALGAGAVWEGDPGYPERLKEIPSPPPVLFFRSRLDAPLALFERPCVAVIGTRRPSPYGEEAATRFSRDLAREGAVVVSGLAYGIDTRAHEGALAGGGQTVAVLANGIDGVYPRENERLADRIAAEGAILTELPPGTAPKGNLFPARNRIISGLCDATAVVEASARSGTMITAGCALDQGRDVFAVPGSIFSERSDGTNQLLKEGAFVLTDVEDLLSRLPASRRLGLTAFVERTGSDCADEPEAWAPRILDILAGEPLDADGLALRLGVGIAEMSTSLAMLEFEGRIRRENGRYWKNRAVL
jgi:DNA processing protein